MGFINTEKIYFEYKKGNPVIDDMSIDFKQGILTAIEGPNGSGKSTLGKLMIGILKPLSGRVLIDGDETASMNPGQAGKKVGYLFQNPERQIFTLNVREELSFIMRLKCEDGRKVETEVEKMLDIFQLAHLKNACTFNLSRGEKQRLAIAAILINKPLYLVLDEPTTGLDWLRKNMLKKILEELLSGGVGMTIISHDIDFVSNIADDIVTLKHGGV